MSDTLGNDWVEESVPGQSAGAGDASEVGAVPQIECWRCGKTISQDFARCPYCEAPLARESSPVPGEYEAPDRDAQSLARLMGVFAILLATSLVAGLVSRGMAYVSANSRHLRPQEALVGILILEAIETVLILAAWKWIGLRYTEPRRAFSRRVVVWLLALPMLAGVLLLNSTYHRLLHQWLGVVPVDELFTRDMSHLAGWIIAICVQPALIEELFYRYMAFGALRPVIGGQAVVWVTAVMFAAAHIGAPLSLPVLLFLGVFLGYSRLASGGIVLPVVLHFLHNAAVMVLNAHCF
jgi:uncharacterized protein